VIEIEPESKDRILGYKEHAKHLQEGAGT